MLKTPFLVLLLIYVLLGSVFVISRRTKPESPPVITPTPVPGKFCGGFAGISCPAGFVCKLAGNYPDAGGECVSLSPTTYLKPNPVQISTCIPRPPCLDSRPRCLIPETADMCPPSISPSPVINCPPGGWVDCMPGPGPIKPQCRGEYLERLKSECPDFQGIAY